MKKLFLLLFAFAIVFNLAAETVKASQWGFDKDNATECLQKAIDSGAKKILIDNTGSDWIIDPVKLRSDLELIIGKDVTVLARPGGFLGVNDSLFTADGLKNITIRGESGATLKMNRQDYADKARYKPSEWRHGICLRSCENVVIRDLAITGSGGDGIYLGALAKPQNFCKDITIENIVADDHHRQGLSVISVENLLVRNCTFNNTKGTLPMSGIDLEPNQPDERLVNCVIEKCTFNGNDGSGADIYILHYNEQSPPMSITFRDCTFNGNNRGIFLEAGKSRGKVEYINCRTTNSRKFSALLHMPGKGLEVSFDGCSFSNSIAEPAFRILANRPSDDIGSIHFKNTAISDLRQGAVPVIIARNRIATNFVSNISGEIKFNNRVQTIAELLKGEQNIDNLLEKNPLATPDNFTLAAPPAAAKPRNPDFMRFRNKFSMVFLANSGDKIGVAMTGCSMIGGVSKARIGYQLQGPDGAEVKKGTFLADTKTFNLEFDAAAAGIYTLKIDTNRQQVHLQSNHPGQAMCMENGVLGLVKAKGKLYFEVPRGAAEFHIGISTDPGEPVSASLTDPNGKKVQTFRDFTGLQIFSGRADDQTAGKLWALEFEKAIEDIYIHFLTPLSPYASPSPDLLIRF